ncbi:MAG: oligosaccharide flippase family protein [Polyangiaceae bacterium]
MSRPLARALTILGPYGVALTLQRVAALVVVPVLTWTLRPAELGAYAVLGTLAYFAFMALVDLGLGMAAFRLAADDGSDPPSLFASVLWIRLAIALSFFSLAWLTREQITRWLIGEAGDPRAVLVAVGTLVLRAATQTMSDYLRFLGRDRAAALFLGTLGVLEATFAFVFVWIMRWGYQGWVAALLAAQLIALPPLAFATRRILKVGNRSAVRLTVALGWPIGVMQALYALRELDRFLVGKLHSLGEAGSYDVAVKLGAPFAAFNTVLILGLEQRALTTREPLQLMQVARAFARAYLATLSVAAFLVAMLSPEILLLFGPDYRGAAPTAAVVLFLPALEGVRRTAGLGMDLRKRTRGWFWVAAANGAVAIALALLLSRRFGGMGAAVGLVLGAAAGCHVAARACVPLGADYCVPVRGAVVLAIAGAVLAVAALGRWPVVWEHLPWRLAAALGFGALCARLFPFGRQTWSRVLTR